MGCTFPLQELPTPQRVAQLRKQLESLGAVPGRFAPRAPISNQIDAALPFHGLPLGCIHEVQATGLSGAVAFAALLSARLPQPDRQTLYVSSGQSLHITGLLPFGIQPEHWIHITARRSRDIAWTVLEALRCPQVGTVLAELKTADLTLCRRFQLAAEESGVTAFLLTDPAARPAIASVITRWRISSLVAPPQAAFNEPCWTIDLSYCRGGRPGQWSVVWRNGQLAPLELPQVVRTRPVQHACFVPARSLAG